ncbi:MAG: SufD family Fe-S cluster assembly protein [Thermoproteota archaeon]|nr:SufD family Fe-S cluster assembly protein [Candidatus Brockarchaeota archaeon]MBO3762850.1 SufD family Fe-S cluster assembly protein [Candidatus Brockarchaeota archaeon]MBO3768242.1 SufD family Fe-S cluster assembly protein [Candidatus Brockarchaeota archaeon]MBO3801275.1 SufD family Fe-S cluster assembly protein [Candidatus Brockarchaeota archaeon]
MNKNSLKDEIEQLKEIKHEESKHLHPPSWKQFDESISLFKYNERWKYLDTEKIFLESKRIRKVEFKEVVRQSQYKDYDGAILLENNLAKVYICDSSGCSLSSTISPDEIFPNKIIKALQSESSKDQMEANSLASSSWGSLISSKSNKKSRFFYSGITTIPISLFNVIHVDKNSFLDVNMKHYSKDVFHEFTYIQLEKNSSLTLNVFLSSSNYSSIINFKIKMEESSLLNLNLVQSSSSTCSSNIEVQMTGKHSEFNFKSLFQSRANGIVDNNLSIYHLEEDTKSNIESYGITKSGTIIIKDWSNIVFNSSSTFIKGKVILLGEESKAYVIPNLKTKGNKISASHGISLGRITQNELFYLMSRGLSEDEANILVSTGFIEHALDSMSSEMLKNKEIKSYLISSLKG